MDLSKKTEDKNIKIKAAKIQIIKYLDVVKNYDSTIIWSQKALSYPEIAKDSLSLIQVYQYLAISYYYKDYFDSATYFYIKSTEIAEVSNDEQELIKSYGSLANVYSLSQDFKTAQIYRKKAYLLAQKNNNINQQIKISFNISASYINQDELDSAIVYAKEAVFLSEKANFGIGLYRSLTKLSECYYKKGENEKALQTIEKAIGMPEKEKDPRYKKYVLFRYSNALEGNKFYKKAKENIYKTLTLYNEKTDNISDKTNIQDNYYSLSRVYTYLYEPDSSVFYLKKAIDLSGEITIVKVLANTSDLQTKYETEKKEQQIKDLEQQKRINKLES